MSRDFEETRCTRYAREHYKGTYYVLISDYDVMITVPWENRSDMAEERSTLTAQCRLASKLRKEGYPWEKIIYQLEASSLTPTTITAFLAKVLKEHWGRRSAAIPAEMAR